MFGRRHDDVVIILSAQLYYHNTPIVNTTDIAGAFSLEQEFYNYNVLAANTYSFRVMMGYFEVAVAKIHSFIHHKEKSEKKSVVVSCFVIINHFESRQD